MVFWNLAEGVLLTELVGDFAVLLKVSSALTEKALTDHAALSDIVAQFLAPLACFLMLSRVGY
jgi:hypothetical protein